MEKLGTLTRSQIILQIDPSVGTCELRKRLEFLEELDTVQGLKNKKAYYAKQDPAGSKKSEHGTFIVNYTGRMDWGEVADYVESYVVIVEGHILLEITSLADKICVSYMQLIKGTKYVDALKIPYKLEGPFTKNLPKHELPREKL